MTPPSHTASTQAVAKRPCESSGERSHVGSPLASRAILLIPMCDGTAIITPALKPSRLVRVLGTMAACHPSFSSFFANAGASQLLVLSSWAQTGVFRKLAASFFKNFLKVLAQLPLQVTICAFLLAPPLPPLPLRLVLNPSPLHSNLDDSVILLGHF